MGNTELRPINDVNFQEYYVDTKGFLYRKLSGRPRMKGNSCYLHYNSRWFILIKPGVSGKYKNYLVHNTGSKIIRVHRAVLSTFSPVDDFENLQVNHKDRNTFNNELSNLEWVTNKENCEHRMYTSLPAPYPVLKQQWEIIWKDRWSKSDTYQIKATGGTQVYDKDFILELLANTSLTKEQIASVTGSSVRSVRYWQEKEKVKRYTLKEIVSLLLYFEPDLTKQDLVKRTGSLVTSINTILRQLKGKV